MDAFAGAMAVLFADPHMARPGLYLSAGAGPGTPCRVILGQPDVRTDFGGARIVADSVSLEVLVAEVPALADGDRIEIGDERFRIVGAPIRDSLRLVWTAEARPE